jgi:hypothetical protein
MTTEVQARDAIIGFLHPAWTTAYPAVKIFYETASVDLDAVGSTFLRVRIDFVSSTRQGIDLSPITGSYGELLLQMFMKDGSGTREPLVRINFLRELLKYKIISGVTLDCPKPGRKQSRSGWTSSDLIVPFQFWQ